MSKKTSRPYTVEFSNSADFIRSLNSLTFGALPPLAHCPGDDAVAFANQACALALAAESALAHGSPPTLVAVAAIGDVLEPVTPLTWLNISESSGHNKGRDCHQWYLTVEEAEIRLTYVHGKWGYRHENFTTWSTAFARLAILLAGTTNWEQFGNDKTRATLVGKGQFYWVEPLTAKKVPVDNFVLCFEGGYELKLEGLSHKSVLALSNGSGDCCAFEWCDDYAAALLRMAGLLKGAAPWSQFGADTKANAVNLPADGRFVVKSIYQYGDVLEAPRLSYVTAEQQQVHLGHTDEGWAVHTWNVRGGRNPATKKSLPEALELFAELLISGVWP